MPLPAGGAGPSSPAGTSAFAAATATLPNPSGKRGRNRLIIIVPVAMLLALIAAGTALFLTYRAEVWGGKSLPDPASIAASVTDKNGKKASVVKAKDVTEALKAKGLNAKTEKVFSGEDEGNFVGYKNAAPGARVKAGSTVVVQESAGPGVPKGTVGKDVNKVVNTFADMGVPIHYKKVVIAQDSKTPEGQVGVTYPADGTGLQDADKNNGIYIGVTSKGEGIPVDILGSDKSKAAKDLASQVYHVSLEPHYSSKQYVGKISGSDPAPGSTLSSGQSVTLYYGIDKSSNMDVLSKTQTSGNSTYTFASLNPNAMIGTYCKSKVTDADKDCFTLEQAKGLFGGAALHIVGEKLNDDADTLGLANFAQNMAGLMALSPDRLDEKQAQMKNHLLTKDWGMFELYAGLGLANCGNKTYSGSPGEYCDHGELEPEDSSSGNFPSSSGLTYEMKDFLVYFPVGADIPKLEDSGYFDSESLAAAKKQKSVDASRPFIVMRDKSQYSETSVDVSDRNLQADPFVPTNSSTNNYQNALVPMKPAPSDSTVYYLVEQNADLDWDSLPDAEVKTGS